MARKETDIFTWVQQHNILPIITAFATALGTWYALDKRVYLQEQRLQYIQATADSCIARIGQAESKNYEQSLDIKELQTKGSVKGISTQVSRPTPVPTEKE